MKIYSYEEIRGQIDDGDIIFTRGSWKDPIQALIMSVTDSLLSHACIAFWSYPTLTSNPTENRLMVIEIFLGTKGKILPFETFNDRLFCGIKAPKEWSEVKHTALAQVGKRKYSLWQFTHVGLRDYFWNTFKIRLPRFKHSPQGEICSEFIARVYELSDHDVSPQGLWNHLVELGSKTI